MTLPNPWQALHAALMPDYNRKATVFWWSMVLAGIGALLISVSQVAALPPTAWFEVACGVLLAMLMAVYPLKVPRTGQSFTVGDVFIVLLVLNFGAAAGCLAAGTEGLVSACRSSRRWTTRLGTATIASFSVFACGHVLGAFIERFSLLSADRPARLVSVAMAFGLVYCLSNAVLMSTVARLKRDEWIRWSDFFSAFGWVGGASAGSAGIAALLFMAEQTVGLTLLLIILPIIGLLLLTLHFFNRQQATEDAARKAETRALAREAELAGLLSQQREREASEQHMRQLEHSERRFQSAFTQAYIGMALVSLDGHIHLANPALHTLLGCADNALHGRQFAEFVATDDLPHLDTTLAIVAHGPGGAHATELCCRRPDGAVVWVNASCSLFSEPDAAGPSLIMQIQDITARRSAEAALEHRACHDMLTGLPNRERFHNTLGAAIERALGGPGRGFAVLFLDFDRFKLINDSKGHSVGDEFLVQASRRLALSLRKGDMLARLGGDEFAILANGIDRDADATDLGERLLQALRAPLQLSEMEITASASIGITCSSIGYARPEDMLRDADIAMYRAKAEGKARYAIFDVTLHAEVTQRVRLEEDLRQALADGALSVVYQPIYVLATGKLEGFESLARWHHPELGPISPATFIPIAEESGLIVKLTEFVIRTACSQLVAWQRAQPGRAELIVHVNVAGLDLADANFVARVQRTLAETGLASRHLVIELTENILMVKLEAAMETLKALRELGVGLSIDDFGTGYSSLSHLAVLPIDSLKIDMSFVRNLRAGSKEAAIIRAIVLLGMSLDKVVIAEGIETQAQMELLNELGCALGQGYHLSRPLAPPAVEPLLRSTRDDLWVPSVPLVPVVPHEVFAPSALMH